MHKESIPLLVALAFGVCTNTALLQAADEKSKDEQAIQKVEQEWAAALVKGDLAMIDHIEAQDWTLADPEGNLIARSTTDADIKSGKMKFESVHADEFKVRVFGDSAIAFGLVTEKSKYDGKDTSGQFRFTDVFVKRDGRWQAVCTQLTRVATR
jgi:ketosteroid isomerase-like protein